MGCIMTHEEAIECILEEIDFQIDYGELPESEYPDIVHALRMAVSALLRESRMEENHDG